MPRFPFFAGAAVVAATVGWALRLVAADEPLAGSSAVLVAADALLLAVVATAGFLLARSQWARYVAVGLLAAETALAAALPRDGWTWAVLAGVGTAGVLVAAPPASRWVRRLPAAGGPPRRVVVLLVVLLAMPGAVGLAVPDGPGVAQWALTAAALTLAWGYSKAHASAVWGLRLGFPAVALAGAVTAGWPGGAAIGAVAAAVTALAWLRDARLAALPLAPPRVETYRIPPELAPPEVLDAAGLDRSGRRRAPDAQ